MKTFDILTATWEGVASELFSAMGSMAAELSGQVELIEIIVNADPDNLKLFSVFNNLERLSRDWSAIVEELDTALIDRAQHRKEDNSND